MKGAADLIGIIKPSGRFLAIEVKTARGRLRPEQANFLRLVKAFGGVAGVARSVEEAHAIVNAGKASAELAGDEIAVLEYVKARLVEGKRVYGQLQTSTDARKWVGMCVRRDHEASDTRGAQAIVVSIAQVCVVVVRAIHHPSKVPPL